MVFGVLALQGDFKEHLSSLKLYDIDGIEVKTTSDLSKINALIIPGGESTAMSKLLLSTGLDRAIRERAVKGMPIWGTCAGAILLAKNVISPVPLSASLDLLDITIERNSYGRQTESFSDRIAIDGKTTEVFFIRAPRILKIRRGVKVLARRKKDPILVRQKNILASTFHTELKFPNVVLEYFLKML